MGFVDRGLSGFFRVVGHGVGTRPKTSICGAVLVSLFFGSGLFWAGYENNLERLYTNRHGPYEVERRNVDALFPIVTKGEFDISRIIRIGRFARLIIEAKDGGTLFRKSVWDEILEVDKLIHEASFKWKDEGAQNYSTLCGRWDDQCYENEFLELGQIMADVEDGSLEVSFPIMFNPETFKSHILAHNLGGVKLTNDSFSIDTVQAVNLNYVLAIDTEADDERGYAWEGRILEVLEEAIPNFKQITVHHQTFKSFAQEQDSNVLSMIPYISVTIMFMAVFLISTSISTDWVTTKPWAVNFGMLCCGFGTLAGTGIICMLGYPIIAITVAVPFIMLGIGIDDTFVILAAWRQTDPLKAVPERLADCFSEAGVSITITTLTDMLSFYVGIMTPIPSVQIFSAFAGTSVLGIYLMQLFLFGGILAISGAQEEKNMHAISCWTKAVPKSKAENRTRMFNLFCTGGIDRKDPHNPKNRSKKAVMTFFRDNFANIVVSGWGKASIVILFLIYLGISGYGLTTMEEGLQLKRIYREDSYLYEYIEKEHEYFRIYPHRSQILILDPVDYSNKTFQKELIDMMNEFAQSKYITLEYTENWLQSYNRHIADSELNVTDESSFIANLRPYLDQHPRIRQDVKFNENFTQILASRFIIQTKDLFEAIEEKELVAFERTVAQNQPFNVSLYHPWVHFVDQYLIIQSLTIQLIATASAIVMAVAIVFIPNLMCSVFVFLTIATIEIGVMGFMCLWGISLDIISLICLIMCIGFSVDFTAHISYAYITAEGSSEERIRKALYGLGLPIVQGGVSTIIGVSALWLIPSYIFRTFAKVVSLVIVFAAWHGLFVLPVMLLIVQPERFSLTSSLWPWKKYDVTQAQPIQALTKCKLGENRSGSMVKIQEPVNGMSNGVVKP